MSQQPTVIDPDNIPETPCIGKFHVQILHPIATLTFCHERPKADRLLNANQIEMENIVRARIVMTVNGLHALRNVLDELLKDMPQSGPVPAARSTTLN